MDDLITYLRADITGKYGPLVTTEQLAELMQRSVGGMRFALTNSNDPTLTALKKCARRVGRRIYYPAASVAQILGEAAA